MTTTATRKLLLELKNMKDDQANGMGAAPFESNMMVWAAYIHGYSLLL